MSGFFAAGSLYLAVALTSVFALSGTAQACGQAPCTNDLVLDSLTKAGNPDNLISEPIGYSARYAGTNLLAPDSRNDGSTGTFNTINDNNGMFYGQPGVGDYAPLAEGVPGWILLGYETVTKVWDNHHWTYSYAFEPSAIAGSTISEASSWFSVTGFKGSDDSGESGTWAFNLPGNLLEIIEGYPAIADLFDGHLFDQFSLAFFGDTTRQYEKQCVKYKRNGKCKKWQKVLVGMSTPYVAYDFTAEDLGLSLSPDPIFNFAGTWESCFDVNMIALYVRDPATSSVPEPGSLALLGLGLAGLYAGRRKYLSR